MFSIFLHINLADVLRAIIWTFFHSLWFAIVVGAGIILLQILIHKASPLVKHLTYSLIFGLAVLTLCLKFTIELRKADISAGIQFIENSPQTTNAGGIYEVARFPDSLFIDFVNRIAIPCFCLWLLLVGRKIFVFFHYQRRIKKIIKKADFSRNKFIGEWFEAQKKYTG